MDQTSGLFFFFLSSDGLTAARRRRASPAEAVKQTSDSRYRKGLVVRTEPGPLSACRAYCAVTHAALTT